MNKNLKKILDTLTIIKEKTINFLSKAFDSIKNTAKKNQEMKKNKKQAPSPADETIIKNNKKWFDRFVVFPECVAIINFSLIVIWAIVDPLVVDAFDFGDFFGSFALWIGIGLVYCLSLYFTLKTFFAPIILKTYYLKSIEESLKKNEQ